MSDVLAQTQHKLSEVLSRLLQIVLRDTREGDVLVGNISQRAWNQAFQQRWDYPGQLAPGPHTLKLVFVTPDKRNRTRGSLDAVIVR